MSYQWLDASTTFCENTPENWKEFYQLKAKLNGQKQPVDETKPQMRLSRSRNTTRRCYNFHARLK